MMTGIHDYDMGSLKQYTISQTSTKTTEVTCRLHITGTGPIVISASYFSDNSTSAAHYCYCIISAKDYTGANTSTYTLARDYQWSGPDSVSYRIGANAVAIIYMTNLPFGVTRPDWNSSEVQSLKSSSRTYTITQNQITFGKDDIVIRCRATKEGTKNLRARLLIPSSMTVNSIEWDG